MTQTTTKEPTSQRTKMTYEEFLQWSGENQHVEWENGEVIFMPPVSDEHSSIGLFLLRIMGEFAEAHQCGVIRYEPFQMKTGADFPGRSPDIIFIATENLSRIKPTYLDGPADLVVEIISPESLERDRGTKFNEYEQGGVREYWLVDPMRRQAEFYQRGEDGYFHNVPVGDDGIYRSAAMPGIWINAGWLWQQPKPGLFDVLKQWGML
jgi:Uma2 family endonuclease